VLSLYEGLFDNACVLIISKKQAGPRTCFAGPKSGHGGPKSVDFAVNLHFLNM